MIHKAKKKNYCVICVIYDKVSKYLFKEINAFIQQKFIKLIQSDSKDIYNVKKNVFQIALLFWNFYSTKNPEQI